jgi:predicted glycogen debranching enzyme
MIRIDFQEIGRLDDSREWLETDGRGGYASSTLENRHTRRYHGLLVANLQTPEGRHVLLSKLEDSLEIGEEEHFLSSHRYPGVLFPQGYPVLDEFLLDTCPRFIRRIGPTLVRKSVLMPFGKETLLVRYDLEQCPKNAILRLRPFLAFRGYHKLSHKNLFLRDQVEEIEDGFRIAPYEGMPHLFIQTSRASRFTASPVWYNRFQYTEERERGFDWEEDLFLPGMIEIPVEGKCTVILSVSRDEDTMRHHVPITTLWKSETARRGRNHAADAKILGNQPEEDREILSALLDAGRSFLITTPSGRPAVIAGYPWFGSWGRDTLISLPGLCFYTGRVNRGIDILTEIGLHEKDGLLPNFFSADGAPEAYNTVDSSLWFFWAVQELLRVSGKRDLVLERFWPVMKRIVRSFMEGTQFEIRMDQNGLLHAGDGKAALTWMDATVGEIPVTPRHGFPVEINALWYNALCFTRTLAEEFGDPVFSDADPIPALKRSFREVFRNPQGNGLGDVYRDGVLDCSIRPNQIFAVALPFSPLEPDEQASVVRTVRDQLLTPCGLRTLSPADPAYRGIYQGDPEARDGAYHQGTVWPWLLGAFGEASLRVAADPEREKETLRQYLRAFLRQHLCEAGIGSVSEVFDGDAPHCPGGCIAQAWSVAELIRLYMLLSN